MHCIQTEPEKKSVLDKILKQRTMDVGIKKYAISLLGPSLEYTNKVLKERELDIRDQISNLGGSTILEQMMDQLSIAYTK